MKHLQTVSYVPFDFDLKKMFDKRLRPNSPLMFLSLIYVDIACLAYGTPELFSGAVPCPSPGK